MSNHLAIATVTAALAQVVQHAAEGAVAGVITQFGRPEAPANGAGAKVFVYLYQVTPNAALRNSDLPMRDEKGVLVSRPRAAINLHYLLTFYGAEATLEPSRMLGAVARDLHANPVLSAQAIQDVTKDSLADSDLVSAIEQVKFTQEQLSLEDFSRIWSVLVETPHALSVAYQASVVLIDALESGAGALPVLSRGEGDTGVDTRIGPFPRLDSVWMGAPAAFDRIPRLASQPAARLGDRLLITGENLGGDTLTLRFSHSRRSPEDLPVRQFVIPAADRSASAIRVDLPDDVPAQSEWAAGVYLIEVGAMRAGKERLSNVTPLALAPRITAIQPNPAARNGGGDVTLDVTCHPQVLPHQSAFLLLAGRETPPSAHVNPTDTLHFELKEVPAFQQALIRLRVDGVDSLPFRYDAATKRFVFDEQQRVTIT